ncbi:Uncharacterised protein [Chlamydia trachomatis]|nr:Uncharacterised protein [Chlamydia trachomatis]
MLKTAVLLWQILVFEKKQKFVETDISKDSFLGKKENVSNEEEFFLSAQ